MSTILNIRTKILTLGLVLVAGPAFFDAGSICAQSTDNRVSWVDVTSGQSIPSNAIRGGAEVGGENHGKTLYICRADHSGGWHPGKLFDGKCSIGYGGNEIVLSRYQVATGSGYWDKPKADYAGALIGGSEGARALYVCRANSRGQHPGKVVDGKCNFGYGSKELSIEDFEVFYPQQSSAQTTPGQSSVDTLVAFRTPGGRFITAGAGGRDAVGSMAVRINTWEQFRLISRGGSKYAVQVFASGKYFTTSGGGGLVTAKAASVGRTEEFTLACTKEGWCALQAEDGSYIKRAKSELISDAKTATIASLLRLLTPRRVATGDGTARAKSANILSQVMPVIVLGSVGYDRFEGWLDACEARPADRNYNLPNSCFVHLDLTRPGSASGGGDSPLEPNVLPRINPETGEEILEPELAYDPDRETTSALFAAPAPNPDCIVAVETKAEYEKFLKELNAYKNVKNNADYMRQMHDALDRQILEGGPAPPATKDQETIAIALEIPTGGSAADFRRVLRDRIGRLLFSPPDVTPEEIDRGIRDTQKRLGHVGKVMRDLRCPDTQTTNSPMAGTANPQSVTSSSNSSTGQPGASGSAANAAWNGTWLGMADRLVYTFRSTGSTVSASYSVELPGTYYANGKGSGKLSNCTVTKKYIDCLNCNDELAKCDWTGNYKADNLPYTEYKGIARISSNGKTMLVSFHPVDKDGKETFLDKHDLTRRKQ